MIVLREEIIKLVLDTQRGGGGEVLLVHQTHDVAVDLHIGVAAGNPGVVIAGDAGAVAVEGRLVANSDGDFGGRLGHRGLVAAVQRVLHTALRVPHHDGASGQRLQCQRSGRCHERPAVGDAVVVVHGPVGRAGGVDGLGALHGVTGVLEPVFCTAVLVDAAGGQAGHGTQIVTVVEHLLVAVGDQRGGGQHGGGGEVRAAVEHLLVAVGGQRGGGQRIGDGCKVLAVVEHLLVAFFGQRGGGQHGGGGEGGAVGEHAHVAFFGQRGGGQRGGSSQI